MKKIPSGIRIMGNWHDYCQPDVRLSKFCGTCSRQYTAYCNHCKWSPDTSPSNYHCKKGHTPAVHTILACSSPIHGKSFILGDRATIITHTMEIFGAELKGQSGTVVEFLRTDDGQDNMVGVNLKKEGLVYLTFNDLIIREGEEGVKINVKDKEEKENALKGLAKLFEEKKTKEETEKQLCLKLVLGDIK